MTNKNNRTINDEIQDQISYALSQTPTIRKCEIIKNYPNDPYHVDVELEDTSQLKTISLIGENTVGIDGLLFFLDGDSTKPIVITSTNIINGGGIEIEGNGLSTVARLTHSTYTENNTDYALFGLVDNAYHNFTGCDTNNTYSWFIGLRIPVNGLIKDNENAEFVIMYNDTTYDSTDIHELDNDSWHTVFSVGTDGFNNE